ncbi:spermidine synthase [Actinosynnema sp. NPDC002837]
MSARFQELDWRQTPLGELVLRRRWDPVFDREVHEIKLNDEFLMSSLFTVSEVELARLALADLPAPLDVVVGGLGLGYTARTVLENPAVRSVVVIDALGEVIEWHRRGLLPGGQELASDPRCRLVHGDFFALSRSDGGLDPTDPDRLFHAIIVDIDHSPRHLLHPDNADFYEPEGLRRLAARLHPGGVFALWSNDPPDDDYTAALADRFAEVGAEVVRFHNPLQQREATATVYLARTAGGR